jgi:hypothetical protein
MPIITKPSPLEKNATGVFSLDKTALALHPIVVASSHFSSPNVWDKIIVKYKSETLGQFESIEFDASLASPEGQFFVSETAEDIFEIEKITIVDKDGAILLIPRAELIVAEFDIDFSVVAPELPAYVIWDLLNGPTTNEVGGLFTNSNAANWNKLAKSSNGFGGDFTLTFVFDSADDNEIALGVSKNKTDLSDFSDGYAMLNRYNQGFFEFLVGTSNISGNYPIPASGVQNLIVQRVGDQLTFTLNQTLLVTETVTGTLYPLGRAFLGNIISTYYDITEAPAVQSVTWNVAEKTGVGTVTTGDNGLITKSGGGAGYNVNVLSNETITGDGYVEFINSPSFINVIFGLAEINDPSGFFGNIIIGGYNTGSQGLEKVYNDGSTFFYGGSVGSANIGDVFRFGRVGTTYYIKINGTQVYSITNSNTNPVKASVTIYSETGGVNNVTISL